MNPTANKGSVVERLSRYLKIPMEKIATIGDQANDLLMFKGAAFTKTVKPGRKKK